MREYILSTLDYLTESVREEDMCTIYKYNTNKGINHMNEKSNERLYQELEKFVMTRLKPLPFYQCFCGSKVLKSECCNSEERLEIIDNVWETYNCKYKKKRGDLVCFPQLTNHEICHEMFWNAFRGHSRMYIQMPNLNAEENRFLNYVDKGKDIESIDEKDEKNIITLSCTLLTLQMLDYDVMMFRAMNDQGDKEYRDAAINHYRPYLFNYVAEIDQKKFEELQKLQQQKYSRTSENNMTDARNEPYLWLEASFNPDINSALVNLNGYVVQSASSINKVKIDLAIIEDEGTSFKVKKDILNSYNLRHSCMEDNDFIKELGCQLDSLSSIYVYRIGNGNCVYAENKNKDKSFFYDIGFNHKHRPKKLSTKSTYNYSSTMRKIFANNPSFFILSHWDLDHIAGSFAARKDFLDKKWFAPDCFDACTDAQRLAKYLDLKGNLFCVGRENSGRMIGKINIGKNTTYKLFMGAKASCDRSYPNCEGIVIKYEDTDNIVMMMGDVNYASFNTAINNYNTGSPINPEPLFADTQIKYLIVPHHGSGHTDYNLILDSKPGIKGFKAIICCTDVADDNRPNSSHKEKLEKRFIVSTTETDAKTKGYIEIRL